MAHGSQGQSTARMTFPNIFKTSPSTTITSRIPNYLTTRPTRHLTDDTTTTQHNTTASPTAQSTTATTIGLGVINSVTGPHSIIIVTAPSPTPITTNAGLSPLIGLIGLAALIPLILLIVICVRRRKRKEDENKDLEDLEISEYAEFDEFQTNLPFDTTKSQIVPVHDECLYTINTEIPTSKNTPLENGAYDSEYYEPKTIINGVRYSHPNIYQNSTSTNETSDNITSEMDLPRSIITAEDPPQTDFSTYQNSTLKSNDPAQYLDSGPTDTSGPQFDSLPTQARDSSFDAEPKLSLPKTKSFKFQL